MQAFEQAGVYFSMDVPTFLRLLPSDDPVYVEMLFHANQYLIQTFIIDKFRDPAQFQ